jgi:polyisoprenoid-binding protein YceI
MIKTKMVNLFAVAAVITVVLSLASVRAQAQTAPAPASLAGTWTIDPAHTSVNFTISHMGISEVEGRFDTVAGTIVADPANLASSSVQFTIQVDSVNTNMPYRDSDLKSSKYFDAATYPTISFQSTKIVKVKDGYHALGNLTIRGVTKLVSLPFTLAGPIEAMGQSRIGVVLHTTINRVDYGVGGNDTLSDGSFTIGQIASVDISLEATPAKPAAM